MAARASTRKNGLPARLRPFFWDCRFASLSWRKHRDFVIGRILSEGDWPANQWLRRKIGDEQLREWIISCQGRRLSRKQLRFWELILDLPHREVNRWLSRPERQIWDRRSRP